MIIEMDWSPEWRLADESPLCTNLESGSPDVRKVSETLRKNAGLLRVTVCMAPKPG